MKKIAEYRAFTSLYYRLALLGTFLLLTIIGVCVGLYLGVGGIFIIGAADVTVMVFSDYYIFAGVSARKQRGMEMIKASFCGYPFINKVLNTDLVIKALIILASFIGFIVAITIDGDKDIVINSILFASMLFPLTGLSLKIVLIIARRVAVTLVAQIMITYLASIINTILCFILSAVLPLESEHFTAACIILALVFEAASVLTAVFLKKDCLKGYKSGFYDI